MLQRVALKTVQQWRKIKHHKMELKVMRVISFQYPVPLRWDGRDVERAIIRALDKVLDYTTRAKSCRFRDWVKSTGKQPKAHDCRKNHISSSKAMEPDAAVELFNRAPTQGVKFLISRSYFKQKLPVSVLSALRVVCRWGSDTRKFELIM